MPPRRLVILAGIAAVVAFTLPWRSAASAPVYPDGHHVDTRCNPTAVSRQRRIAIMRDAYAFVAASGTMVEAVEWIGARDRAESPRTPASPTAGAR